jgi:hypothetical protein
MGFTNQRTINGASAVIKIGKKVIGYASGITVTEAYLLNRIDVLGQIDSIDIEAVGRTVSGSIAMMRMTFPDPASDGNTASGLYGGGAAANGLTPKDLNASPSDEQRTKAVMDFMNQGFDLQIVDSADFSLTAGGQPIQAKVRYTIKGCRPSSQSFGLSRGSIMGVNVTFEALRLVEDDAF